MKKLYQFIFIMKLLAVSNNETLTYLETQKDLITGILQNNNIDSANLQKATFFIREIEPFVSYDDDKAAFLIFSSECETTLLSKIQEKLVKNLPQALCIRIIVVQPNINLPDIVLE